MVLLQIDSKRVTLAELEGDAPRTVDVDRVPWWSMTAQSVKIESWKTKVGWRGCRVQCIQHHERSRVEILTDPAASSFLKELFQTLVTPGSYHAMSVIPKLSIVNRQLTVL
jgi:hypothetical protein